MFRYGMKCFFEEAARARAPVASQRGARAQLLPRQRHRLPGDALRARPHAAGAHPEPRAARSRSSGCATPSPSCSTGCAKCTRNKLLHLDIKPANVYLRNDGTPLLIDFGAARQMLSAEGMKLPPIYTPGFAAPEHARAARAARPLERHLLGRRDHVRLPSPARRRSRRTRACESDRWCRRARRGPASTPPTCSRSSTGACGSTTCSARRACSPCRKPCSVKHPTIVQASRVGARETQRGPRRPLDARRTRCCSRSPTAWAATRTARSPRRSRSTSLGAAFAARGAPRLADPAEFLRAPSPPAHAAILREAREARAAPTRRAP